MNDALFWKILAGIFYAIVYSGVVFAIVVTALAIYFLYRKRFYAATITLLVGGIFPAWAAVDWIRGETITRRFNKVEIFQTIDPSLPLVRWTRNPGDCDYICRRILATGTIQTLTQTEAKVLKRYTEQHVKTYRFSRLAGCDTDAALTNFAYDIRKCISQREETTLPETYIRFISETFPVEQVYETGFPRLSSNLYSGTFFTLVRKVESGVDGPILAQAFKHVREPAGVLPFINFVLSGAAPRQVVGVSESQTEALDKIMGWSISPPPKKHIVRPKNDERQVIVIPPPDGPPRQ